MGTHPDSFQEMEIENAKRTPPHPGVPYILLDGQDLTEIWQGSLKETICAELANKAAAAFKAEGANVLSQEAVANKDEETGAGSGYSSLDFSSLLPMACRDDVLLLERSGLRKLGALWRKERGLIVENESLTNRKPTVWDYFANKQKNFWHSFR